MSFNQYIKKIAAHFIKKHQLEYWSIKKNETKTLAPIRHFYSDFIFPEMKIIDVGANVGNYSQVFLNLNAKVIGVEPQKFCQNILKKRFRNNQNFKLISAASGAVVSSSIIHKSKSHTIASMNKNWIGNVTQSNRFKNENWKDEEIVSVTTMDNIIKENFVPDYIKIDVEGYEKEVLKGLNHAVNFISFEITLPEMKQAAIDCVNEISRIGNYVFVIPNQDKLIDIKEWFSKTDVLAYIEELSKQSTEISADIFCKKI
ncbi:MAG: FkbM family methyltransferase [Bacteroidetes bacterium]|nr:FkbM family methyltransferase [Bacteroidota bacterium]